MTVKLTLINSSKTIKRSVITTRAENSHALEAQPSLRGTDTSLTGHRLSYCTQHVNGKKKGWDVGKETLLGLSIGQPILPSPTPLKCP